MYYKLKKQQTQPLKGALDKTVIGTYLKSDPGTFAQNP